MKEQTPSKPEMHLIAISYELYKVYLRISHGVQYMHLTLLFTAYVEQYNVKGRRTYMMTEVESYMLELRVHVLWKKQETLNDYTFFGEVHPRLSWIQSLNVRSRRRLKSEEN